MSYDQERAFLRETAEHAGWGGIDSERYRDEVIRRLRKGEEEYGELAYLDRSAPECFGESSEEQADAAGWAGLGLRLLEQDVLDGLPREVADLVRANILEACGKALESWAGFQNAIELYEEHKHLIGSNAPPERPWSKFEGSNE